VNLLADLDRYDAELFTRLCGFGWKVEGHELAQLKGQSSTEMKLHLVPMVFGRLGVHFSEKYTRYGINYAALAHLASLGLILFSEGGYWWHGIPQKTTVFYFGRPIELEFPKPNYPSGTEAREYGFAVGQALLTRAGHELAQVCRPEPVDGFYELTRKRWEGEGIIA
jgi:hypothetical protein